VTGTKLLKLWLAHTLWLHCPLLCVTCIVSQFMVASWFLSWLFFGVLFGWTSEHTKQQILVQRDQHFIHKIPLHDGKMGASCPYKFDMFTDCIMYALSLIALSS
jgi:hypothetical protein